MAPSLAILGCFKTSAKAFSKRIQENTSGSTALSENAADRDKVQVRPEPWLSINNTSTSGHQTNAMPSESDGPSVGPGDTWPGAETMSTAEFIKEALGPATAGVPPLRQAMDATNVAICTPDQFVDGLLISGPVLGRGSYGVVVQGSYQGTTVAVKMMVTHNLEGAAMKELIIAPRLNHRNILLSHATRCTRLPSTFWEGAGALPGFKVIQDAERGVMGRQCNVTVDDTLSGLPSSPPATQAPGSLAPAGAQDAEPSSRPPQDSAEDRLVHVLRPYLLPLQARPGQVLLLSVLELCTMGTLGHAIAGGVFRSHPGRCSARTAMRSLLRTAAEMATGLVYMHETANVVHGDLKPANVLLQASTNDRRAFEVKLADFGVAHVLSQSATSLISESWGTLAYMAPECFSGKFSRATDVWAFGVVLWEMVTGKRPYVGLQHAQILFGVSQGILKLEWPDEPLGLEPLDVFEGFTALGRRCLVTKASERPSMKEVLAEIVALEQRMKPSVLSRHGSSISAA